MDQNQPISPCNGDAISASVGIMARSLQHRRVAWMQDFGDSPTRRSSHSTNPEVERRQPRRDTARPNFTAFIFTLWEKNVDLDYTPTMDGPHLAVYAGGEWSSAVTTRTSDLPSQYVPRKTKPWDILRGGLRVSGPSKDSRRQRALSICCILTSKLVSRT
mgnify:CR=1 FL=1